MRPGINQEWLDLLTAAGITTAMLARLDFASGTVCAWTGTHPIQVVSADSMLNGQTFLPIQAGLMVQIGDNKFSYSGSDALDLQIGIPSSAPIELEAASVVPSEYQGRSATIWRAVLIQPGGIAEPHWLFRRVRTGVMDSIEVSADGLSRYFKLSIEGHAGMISASTQGTYLDQPKFDPDDRSQEYAPTIANGGDAPSKPTSAGWPGSVGAGGRPFDWPF